MSDERPTVRLMAADVYELFVVSLEREDFDSAASLAGLLLRLNDPGDLPR